MKVVENQINQILIFVNRTAEAVLRSDLEGLGLSDALWRSIDGTICPNQHPEQT